MTSNSNIFQARISLPRLFDVNETPQLQGCLRMCRCSAHLWTRQGISLRTQQLCHLVCAKIKSCCQVKKLCWRAKKRQSLNTKGSIVKFIEYIKYTNESSDKRRWSVAIHPSEAIVRPTMLTLGNSVHSPTAAQVSQHSKALGPSCNQQPRIQTVQVFS